MIVYFGAFELETSDQAGGIILYDIGSSPRPSPRLARRGGRTEGRGTLEIIFGIFNRQPINGRFFHGVITPYTFRRQVLEFLIAVAGGARGIMNMNLKILLPFRVFAEKTGVVRMVAEARTGSFGLLPHRRDCVAALAPGIFCYQTETEAEVFVAVDEGVLVKAGAEVLVSVRRAIAGTDLGQLRAAVTKEFLTLDENEQSVRTAVAKLESRFLRRLANFKHE